MASQPAPSSSLDLHEGLPTIQAATSNSLLPLPTISALSTPLPRYLYRVYSPTSAGHNTPDSFASVAAYSNKGHPTLYSIPYSYAKSMLETHFTWYHFPNEETDEFTSWYSSLLYALQFAVRKTKNIKHPKLVSNEADVQICMLDSIDLGSAKGNFFAARDLIKGFDIPERGKLRHDYHTTEYLYHGKLNVKGISATVSLLTLRKEGLFELLPWLDDKEEKALLWLRVQELRKTLFDRKEAIPPYEGGIALRVGAVFGGKFTMPMAVALLSLKNAEAADMGVRRMLRGFADHSPDFQLPHPNYDGPPAPEFSRFADLMNVEFEEVRPRKVDEFAKLVGLAGKLTIDAETLGSGGGGR